VNKLKTPLIFLLLIVLTLTFLFLPEYLFEKSNNHILKTKESLTYNYSKGTISPSKLAKLYCSGIFEPQFFAMFNEDKSNINEELIKEKINTLLKNILTNKYEFLYNTLSKTVSGNVMYYNERKIFITNEFEKPVALNFVFVNLKNEETSVSIFFEEKTQTIFSMEYVSILNSNKENLNDLSFTSSQLNLFFDDYFSNTLNVARFDIYTSIEKDQQIYSFNALSVVYDKNIINDENVIY